MSQPIYEMQVVLLNESELRKTDQPADFKALLADGWQPFAQERTDRQASTQYGLPLGPVYRVWLRRRVEAPA